MNKTNWDVSMLRREDWYKIAGFVIVAVIIWVGYTALIVVPREQIEADARADRLELVAEQLAEVQATTAYETCKSVSYNVYSLDWDAQCENVGKEKDCSLALYERTSIEDTYESKLADCLSIYKAR